MRATQYVVITDSFGLVCKMRNTSVVCMTLRACSASSATTDGGPEISSARDRQPPQQQSDWDAHGYMRFWLGRRLKQLRQEFGRSQRELAANIPGRKGQPLDTSTLSRFEKGETWTPEPDATVAVYAAMCGGKDPRQLWVEAATAFLNGGALPRGARRLSAAELALYLAQEGDLRSGPYDGESPDTPNATPTDEEEP